jgi:hypothetical protein
MPRVGGVASAVLRRVVKKSKKLPVVSIGVRPPTDRLPTEHEEQREFVRWFRQTFADVRIFAIPNGGARSQREGGRFKLEGVSPGVPDLFIPAWLVWIEFKRQKGGSVSPEQRDWMDYLESIGHRTFVAKGAEAGKNYIMSVKGEFL